MRKVIKYLPLICGVSGNELLKEEADFIKNYNPWGIILFARNCTSRSQLKELIENLKILTHKDIPIMIDQEGGRIHRLKYSDEYILYSANLFGRIYETNKTDALEALGLQCKIIANELNELGISVNASPVLDVPNGEESGVIGDRSFSNNKEIAATLGKEAINSFISMGINPVIKHIPGHGRAQVDSHFELPIVDTKYDELVEMDFYPFQACNFSNLAMTAHIVFSNIDPEYPVTISNKIISSVIRKLIKFEGLLMTDDISMKALKGDIGKLSLAALEAGCDLILHCNGNLSEMNTIAETLKSNMCEIELPSYMILESDKNIEFDLQESKARLQNIVSKFVY